MKELEEIGDLVAVAREDEARARLQELKTADIHDARVHRQAADLAEELGMGERLVVELNLGFRDAPDDLEFLRRLAQVHADAGRSERAVKCWRALLERDPDDVEGWEELGELLRSLGRVEETRDAWTRALQQTGERSFEGRLKALAGGPAEEPGPSPDLPEEGALVRFHSLFSGREGVYARQWVNPQGQTGYHPVREPFNVRVVRNHLLGNHTVGIYPIRLDNTVNFMAFDLDLSRSLVDRSGPGRPEWDRTMAHLEAYGWTLLRLAAERGLTGYLEDSGSKGRHVWFFFAEPLQAGFARRLGQALLREAGAPPVDVAVELFPKQSQLPPNGLGNLIKLPLGVHRLTGRKGMFLGPDGLPVADPLSWLMQVQRVSRDAVMRYLEVAAPRVEEEDPPWVDEAPGAPRPAPAVLPDYEAESDAPLQLVLARCVTLRTLVEKADRERTLSHDEANVLVYTLGHLETGPQAVNGVLRRCPTVDVRQHLKSRLRGHPMSCPKIRTRIGHITGNLPCHCEFEPNAGLYPNPLLHLTAGVPSTGGELDTLQFQSLLQDFLRARNALHEAERVHRIFLERMAAWFDQAGVDEFRTPLGVLRRTRGEDGRSQFKLDV